MEKITESVYASGIIKSKNQYQVYAAVSGLIQQILVSEGDVVKKGDMLPLKVVGVFQSGFADFDKVQSFASIATTQKLLPPPIPMSPTFKSN